MRGVWPFRRGGQPLKHERRSPRVEETIESLIDQGELESSLTRVDDPISTVVA
jgi:hypothetical protein